MSNFLFTRDEFGPTTSRTYFFIITTMAVLFKSSMNILRPIKMLHPSVETCTNINKFFLFYVIRFRIFLFSWIFPSALSLQEGSYLSYMMTFVQKHAKISERFAREKKEKQMEESLCIIFILYFIELCPMAGFRAEVKLQLMYVAFLMLY